MSQIGHIHPAIQWITEVKPKDASAPLNLISGVLDFSCEQKTQSSFSEHLSHDLPNLSRPQRKCWIRKLHLHDKILTVDPNIFAIQNINDAKQWNSSGLAYIKAIWKYRWIFVLLALHWVGSRTQNQKLSSVHQNCLMPQVVFHLWSPKYLLKNIWIPYLQITIDFIA